MKGLFIPGITAEMFRNGCLESIEALMAEGKIYDIDYSPWISVSERLPEEDGEYLATIYDMDENYEYIDIAELEDGKWCYKPYILVKAWMPLPEPYKQEVEG